MKENKKNKYYKPNETTKKMDQIYISEFKLPKPKSKDIHKNTNININQKKHKNYLKQHSAKEQYNDDYLLSLGNRYGDIFDKVEGSQKIFEDLKKKYKKKKVSNDIIKGAVLLKKLGFNDHFPKRKKKQIKVDVDKIIEIQKIFKGFFIRNVKFKTDRLRLRQCLIELFSLLVYGNWCRAKVRTYFYLLRECYTSSKMYAGNELTFSDKILFKLPKCFYNGTKVNDLTSEKIGKDLIVD